MTIRKTPQTVNNMRFNEVINGRPYVIEVLPVGRNQWRAQIARPGANAVMPFYGPTPDEAARLLALWLTRVGRPAATAS